MRRLVLIVASLAFALMLPATTFAAAGDFAFARLAQFTDPDGWKAVSTYGTGVFVGGFHGGHAIVRRYNRSGGLVWTRALVTPSKMAAGILGVAADSSGVYVAGYLGEVGDSAHATSQAIVAHYSFSGAVDWYQVLDIPNARVATGIATYGGYVYVVGGIDDSAEFIGPEGSFVRKMTRDGVNVWTQTLPSRTSPTRNQSMNGIAANADGVYVTGWANLYSGTYPIETVLFGQGGKPRWTDFRAISDFSRGVAIAADSTGAYAVADATVNSDPSTGYGGFLLKFTSVGYAWQRRVTEASSSESQGVALAPSGVWIGGTTTARLFNQPPGTVADPHGDVFVARYSRSGSPLLERQYSDPGYQTALAIDADGSGVYLAGDASGYGKLVTTGHEDGFLLAAAVQ